MKRFYHFTSGIFLMVVIVIGMFILLCPVVLRTREAILFNIQVLTKYEWHGYGQDFDDLWWKHLKTKYFFGAFCKAQVWVGDIFIGASYLLLSFIDIFRIRWVLLSSRNQTKYQDPGLEQLNSEIRNSDPLDSWSQVTS